VFEKHFVTEVMILVRGASGFHCVACSFDSLQLLPVSLVAGGGARGGARGLPRFASKVRDAELSRAAPKLAASELALARRTAGAEQAALYQANLRLELTAGTLYRQ
jgi:hypothetical protein